MLRIAINNIKMHVVADPNLVDSVIEDLKNRYQLSVKDFKVFLDSDKEYFFDVPGSINCSTETIVFRLSDKSTIFCRLQNWQVFKDSVFSCSKKYLEKFYKIKTYNSILCLNETQKQELDLILSNHEKQFDKRFADKYL